VAAKCSIANARDGEAIDGRGDGDVGGGTGVFPDPNVVFVFGVFKIGHDLFLS